MIILLDTSTPTCCLSLVLSNETLDFEWEANRTLADGLIGYIRATLAGQSKTWHDVTAVGVRKGPGSFTGLRIGLTVMNTLADAYSLPIVGETGENWQRDALERLNKGENDQLVMPLYGRDANITRPRK